MDIWSVDKLVLFIAFFIPGFIAQKIYGLFVPSDVLKPSQSLLDAIAYSCINYAIFSWILLIHNIHPVIIGIIIFVVLFLSPVALALGYWKIRNSRFLRGRLRHPTPKPWDYVFGQQRSYWIIIELIDGGWIGGTYDTDSFASSFPMNEQIYLQEEWELDGHRFKKPVERSCGIIVSEKDIKSIRFFR